MTTRLAAALPIELLEIEAEGYRAADHHGLGSLCRLVVALGPEGGGDPSALR